MNKADIAYLEALLFIAKGLKVWDEVSGECAFTIVMPGVGHYAKISEGENNCYIYMVQTHCSVQMSYLWYSSNPRLAWC